MLDFADVTAKIRPSGPQTAARKEPDDMSSAIDWTPVATLIATAEACGATIGAEIVPPSGEHFSHNHDRRFVAASTVKIAIMIELFRRIDAASESLDTRHTMAAADKSTGSGILAQLDDGLELTLGDFAYLMMSISDNTATNILIDRLGMAQINATMRSMGMRQSTLGRRMRGRTRTTEEQENWAVPAEYAEVMSALFENRAASAGSCARMLALLESQQNDRRIARHLPKVETPRWGSKTGSLPGVVNDVGFIMTAHGPLILAIYCESPSDAHTGEQIIGDIAKAALDAVT
jgi:beta-lactamase class A